MSLGLHNHGHVRERGREEKEEDFSPVIAKFTTTAAFSHPFSCPHVPDRRYEVHADLEMENSFIIGRDVIRDQTNIPIRALWCYPGSLSLTF